jgi:hypothetical protein
MDDELPYHLLKLLELNPRMSQGEIADSPSGSAWGRSTIAFRL